MDRKLLEELGLEKETIDKVMAAHGKAIQAVKPADDYENLKSEKATLEQQIVDLNTTLQAEKDKYTNYDTDLAQLNSKVKEYETTNLKYKVANQAGLPLDLAGRLSGETEEEIKADAEKLASFVSKSDPLPLKSSEPIVVDEKEQAYAKILENLKGE